MKIQFLGTAAAEAVPGIFCECDVCKKSKLLGGKNIRGRSGCMLNDRLMIDFPPDIYMQSLRLKIELAKVTHIFITHSHSDHFTPAELLMSMPECYAHKSNELPIILYGNEETARVYEEAVKREFSTNQVDFIHFIRLEYYKPIDLLELGLKITYLPALHKLDEKAGIFLIEEQNGRSFLYAHDTGYLPEETFAFLKNKKLTALSLDCTSCGKYDYGHHMGLPNVLDTLVRLREDGCISDSSIKIVNHFSHNGGATYDEMCELTKPHEIIVSYDGMVIHI